MFKRRTHIIYSFKKFKVANRGIVKLHKGPAGASPMKNARYLYALSSISIYNTRKQTHYQLRHLHLLPRTFVFFLLEGFTGENQLKTFITKKRSKIVQNYIAFQSDATGLSQT